jgi:hypothetical protein
MNLREAAQAEHFDLFSDVIARLRFEPLTREQQHAELQRVVAAALTGKWEGAAPVAATLTDEQIDQITAEQWGRGLGAPYAAYRAYARAIEAAHNITAKEAP